MKKQFIGFHGDIDIFRVAKLPKEYKLIDSAKSHTPQSSDSTGHSHTFTSETPFEVYKADDFAYIFTDRASIVHPEHRTEDFELGTYLLKREQEENPRTGLIMEVVD